MRKDDVLLTVTLVGIAATLVTLLCAVIFWSSALFFVGAALSAGSGILARRAVQKE